ncbi:MAG: hypothetical protein DMG26_15625 [Acidobacteria bacterium]|nr:MAG: hypothetical protein DMG26_15625 [Acidobacteriota bacterium]
MAFRRAGLDRWGRGVLRLSRGPCCGKDGFRRGAAHSRHQLYRLHVGFEHRPEETVRSAYGAGPNGRRQSNYLYGAAKAGLSVYLQGLRNRLFPSRVRVVTIKPGFVDTPMTFGRPGLFLVASPEYVARSIFKAIQRGKDVAYIPWFWRPIMFTVRMIPEWLFKRPRL